MRYQLGDELTVDVDAIAPGHLEVLLWGVLDLSSQQLLPPLVAEHLGLGTRLTVDARALRFVDPVGLRALLAIWDRCGQDRITMEVLATPTLRRLASVTWLDRLITFR